MQEQLHALLNLTLGQLKVCSGTMCVQLQVLEMTMLSCGRFMALGVLLLATNLASYVNSSE